MFEGIRIPLAIDEATKKNYENITYSYEIFNEVIIWGMINFPELKNFFVNDTQIFGKKTSFDKDLFDKLSNKNKSLALKDITKDKSEYKKLSKYQKHISDLINDYEPTKKKLEKKNLQYCKNKTKGLKDGEYDMTIIDIIDKNKLEGGRKKTKRKLKKKKKTKRRSKLTRKQSRTKRKHDKKPTMYYFSMDGCPYCNDFDDTWNKLIDKYNKLLLLKKIDKDENPQLVQKYGVTSFPTLKLLKINCRKPIDFEYDRNKLTQFKKFFKENKVV